MSPRLRSTSAILVAFVVPLGVYLASLRGDVSSWDTADLQTVPYILGIPYPTGFPGYVLLGWVWSHIFAVGNVAWRLNVLAAIASAGTSAAVAALLISLGAATAIAFAAAVAYALAGVPWTHATYVDVHPLAFCAVAWACVYAVRWTRRAVTFDGIACVAAIAIALACDNSTVLMLPGLAAIVLSRRPPLLRATLLVSAAIVAVLAVYAYLPLRSAAVTAAHVDPTLSLGLLPGRPYWDDGHPSTWAGFVRVVTGSDFAPHEAVAAMISPAVIHQVVEAFAPLAAHDLGEFFPWIAVFGAAMLWWRMPLVLGGLLLLGLLPLLFASAYPVESQADRYYLPAYFAIAIGAGYGVALFDEGMGGAQRYAVLAAIGLAWFAQLTSNFSNNAELFAQPSGQDGREWIRRVAATTPPRAVIVAPWNYATTLAYGTYVLHALGDRILVTGSAHQYERAYRRWLAERPVVVVSDTAQTFKGVSANEIGDGAPHIYALR